MDRFTSRECSRVFAEGGKKRLLFGGSEYTLRLYADMGILDSGISRIFM